MAFQIKHGVTNNPEDLKNYQLVYLKNKPFLEQGLYIKDEYPIEIFKNEITSNLIDDKKIFDYKYDFSELNITGSNNGIYNRGNTFNISQNLYPSNNRMNGFFGFRNDLHQSYSIDDSEHLYNYYIGLIRKGEYWQPAIFFENLVVFFDNSVIIETNNQSIQCSDTPFSITVQPGEMVLLTNFYETRSKLEEDANKYSRINRSIRYKFIVKPVDNRGIPHTLIFDPIVKNKPFDSFLEFTNDTDYLLNNVKLNYNINRL
jgi:hypothetical protein